MEAHVRNALEQGIAVGLPENPLLATARKRLSHIAAVEAMATMALESFAAAAAQSGTDASHALDLRRVVAYTEAAEHELTASGWAGCVSSRHEHVLSCVVSDGRNIGRGGGARDASTPEY